MSLLKHVTIIGSGAMGCLFASALENARRNRGADFQLPDYTMVTSWQEQIDAIQCGGLRVGYPDGSGAVLSLNVTNDLNSLPGADLVLVLVKGYQTKHVANRIAPLLSENAIVVTLQNGWGNEALLAKALEASKVFQGITSNGAELLRPGLLKVAGIGKTILPQTETGNDQMKAVANLFNYCGLPTEISAKSSELIWQKLAINAAVNPLSALTGLRNGELIADADLKARMFRIAGEMIAVAAAINVELDEESTRQAVSKVCEATSTNRSSMLQDVLRGRQTEIETICGAVVALADQHDILVPENRELLLAIRELDSRVPSGQELPIVIGPYAQTN